MQCLVCPAKFDLTPATATEADLALAAGPTEKEALHVHARRKRATEQSAWKFVQLTVDGTTVAQGHVCPSCTTSVSISKAVGK